MELTTNILATLRKLRCSRNEIEWMTPSRDPTTEDVKLSSSRADSIRKAVLEAKDGEFGGDYLNKSDTVRS